MNHVDLMVIVGWGMMCNVWGVLLWMQRRSQRNGTMVPLVTPDVESSASVTVVIPARNESAGIEQVVKSVSTQDWLRLEIVVVDDRSEDDTAARVRRVASSDPRVRLYSIHQRPQGVMGKSHALAQATRGLTSDWLLFLDADCRLLDAQAIRSAINEAQRRGADLLTLFPRLVTGTWAEAMLIPLCSAVMALWFGCSNHRRARGFANGQFLMVRRSAYEHVGGHASVETALIEDVPLAQALRATGYRTWAGGGAHLVSVRMYDGLRSVFYGWSRIFVGALRRPWKLIVSLLWLAAGSLWPILALPLLCRAWRTTDVSDAPAVLIPMTLMCVTHLVLLVRVSIGFWAMGGCDRRYLWLYPVSVIGVMLILIHAFWTAGVSRRVVWRDNVYRLDRQACIVAEPATRLMKPAGAV